MDMNVTHPRRGYMRLSLQRSYYLERQNGEGGTPAVLNPLALTHHFGWATSTPDRIKAVVQKITCDVHTGGNKAMSAHTPLEAGPHGKCGVLSPALTRISVITERRPQTAVEENDADRIFSWEWGGAKGQIKLPLNSTLAYYIFCSYLVLCAPPVVFYG